MLNRTELKATAKDRLKGNWAYMAGLSIMISIISIITGIIAFIPILGWLAMMCVTASFILSRIIISGKLYQRVDVNGSDIVSGFAHWLKCLGLMLWVGLWTFLWSLLFLIPGIIKGYSYYLAFYALYQNPELSVREALNESKQLTQGYKLSLFILDLSWIGWALLVPFTFGIGLLFLIPYQSMTTFCAFLHIQDQRNMDK